MVQISDNFNRADSSNLGTDWAEDAGSWEIAGNVLNHDSSPGSNYVKLRWVGTAIASADYDVEVDAISNNAGVGVGPLGRGATSATNTYYGFIGFGGDAAYLVEITAGGENILATGGSFPSGTQVNLRLSLSGTSLEGFQNDVSDATATDSTLTAGAPGVAGYGFWNTAQRSADNFFADDFLAATYAQPNFRLRAGDTVGLNVDADWQAALNADATIDAGQVFRARFEVEETAGASGSNAYRLQYNLNAGGWNNVPGTSHGSIDAPVILVISTQYADLDATTNLLAGSAAAFVAGDGVEHDGTNGNQLAETGTIALNNQHTELEFCLVINALWGDNTQLSDGDTIDLRIVEGDDTAFAGTYNNPTITVNLPSGYIGGTAIETPNRAGPWSDSNNNLYALVEATPLSNFAQMMRSTDDGVTWSIVDGANNPTQADLEAIDVQQVGDTLHIAHLQGQDGFYHTFRMSDHPTNPDTWGTVDSQFLSSGTSPNNQVVAIGVRSDGDVIVVYPQGNGAGTSMYYVINTGTWGAQQTLDAEAGQIFDSVCAVMGASDLFHIFYSGRDGTNGDIYHRSLSSADTLSSRELVDTISNGGTPDHVLCGAVYWDDGGNERVMVAYLDRGAANWYINSCVVSNDGSPETVKRATQFEGDYNRLDADAVEGKLFNNGEDIYLIYVDQGSGDIFLAENVNDGAWSLTDTELQNNVDASWVVSNFIELPDLYAGYVWDTRSRTSDSQYDATGYIVFDSYFIATAVSGVTVIPTPADAGGQVVAPSVIEGSLTLTAGVANAIGQIVAPSVIAGSLVLSPTVANAIGQIVAPAVVEGSLVFVPGAVNAVGQVIAPSVVAGSLVLVPTAINAIGQVVPPSVLAGSLVLSPAVANAIGRIVDPAVQAGGSQLVTPGAVNALGQVIAPTVVASSLVLTPGAVNAIGQVIAPSVVAGSLVLVPGAVNAVGQQVAPAVIAGSLVLVPSAVNAVGQVFGPSVQAGGNQSVTPGPVDAVGQIFGPAVVAGSLVFSPAVANAIGQVVAPSVLAGSLMLVPGAVNAIGQIVNPSVGISGGGTTVIPTAVDAGGQVIAPSVIAGNLLLSPTVANAIGQVAGPTVQAGAGVLVVPVAANAIGQTMLAFVILSGNRVLDVDVSDQAAYVVAVRDQAAYVVLVSDQSRS